MLSDSIQVEPQMLSALVWAHDLLKCGHTRIFYARDRRGDPISAVSPEAVTFDCVGALDRAVFDLCAPGKTYISCRSMLAAVASDLSDKDGRLPASLKEINDRDGWAAVDRIYRSAIAHVSYRIAKKYVVGCSIDSV